MGNCQMEEAENMNTATDIDVVHVLSSSQRRQRLLDGFIRTLQFKMLIPTEIKTILGDYMTAMEIKSQTEIEEENTRELKIVVLGPGAVGKSATTIRFVADEWFDEYDPTIEDWYRYQFKVDGKLAKLEILDTAGSCEPPWYEYAQQWEAYIFMYSITQRRSFEEMQQYYYQRMEREYLCWHQVPLNQCGRVLLVGNKIDLSDEYREVSSEEGKALADEWNCPFLEISAKQRINLVQVFETVVRMRRQRNATRAKEQDATKHNCCVCSVL